MAEDAVVSASRGAAITGWGATLPDKVVTNVDLEATMDTNDTWIRERTGIQERRVGGVTSDLAVAAGALALQSAGVAPHEVDLLILATTTPDQTVPGTSAAVQDRLGLRCGAFDLNAACSGFAYGLVAANGMVVTGLDKVLVVGAESLSRITDYTDRGTGILFGDGAGAVVVEAIPGEGQLLGWDLGADGSARSILYADVGGYIQMEGKEVFRRAVRVMVDSASAAMERAKVTADDIALYVPHQANTRIIDAALSRLGLSLEKTAVNIQRTGNTSSASIPMALAEAADAGRVSDGDLVLLSGFGAGMTWASAVWRWGR
ncbi:MAG: 3-oxoacyl-[acyl-carrier-protein] synthase [Acidimicrobiaceae bacterium]|nr:3-oxoacyl-[acyl-carrier-protein] synthase [Acidimicrobiaceae bacterium]